MKQLSIAILVALALCAGLTGTALAHAKRVSSVPDAGARLSKAPAKVTVLFTEEISAKPDQSFLRVTDARGALVATGKLDTGDLDHKTLSATLPGSLADGVYTVSWQALTPDDNGVSHGSFSFGLNAAPGAQPAALEGEEGPAEQPATAAATTTATRPAATATAAAPTAAAGSTPTASAGAPAGLPRTGSGTADVSALALLAALAALACGVWIRAKG